MKGRIPLGLLSGKKRFLLNLLIVATFVVIGLSNYRFFLFLSDYIIVTILALVYVLTTRAYRYNEDNFHLFIGYALSMVGIVYLIQIFLNLSDINFPLSVKLMVNSGVVLLEAFAMFSAPFFIRRKFSEIGFIIGVVLIMFLDIFLVWYFGEIVVQKKILGFGCGIILLQGIGNLFIHRRQLNDSIYFKVAGAMILLAGVSFFRIEESIVNTFKFIPNLLRLGAYVLIYQGTSSAPYELILRELKQSVLIDELTGLYNRQGLREFAKKEMARADREGWSTGVLLMDLDRFKFINDRHGHLAGDRIIQQFANILKVSIRETDIVCRLGGDEFVMMLSAEKLNLSIIRDRILEAVEQWKATDELAVKIGVSIGFSIKEPGISKKLDDILKEADHHMYCEKNKKKTVKKTDDSSQYKIFG